MSVLLDSDILIEIIRGRNAEIGTKWNQLAQTGAEIYFTPVSSAEVWGGAFPQEFQQLNTIFGSLICIPVNEATGKLAGEFMRQFKKSHRVELADALIAASSVQYNAMLWTRNKKHYPMKSVIFY